MEGTEVYENSNIISPNLFLPSSTSEISRLATIELLFSKEQTSSAPFQFIQSFYVPPFDGSSLFCILWQDILLLTCAEL